MSGRALTARQRLIAQRAWTISTVRGLHRFSHRSLLQADASIWAARKRISAGNNTFHHAVTARNASFVRLLPKLAMKFARIPAMFGGLAIGTFAWAQYQATQASNYALEKFHLAKDTISSTASTILRGAQSVSEQTREGWDSIKDQVNMPSWLEKMLRIRGDTGSGTSGGTRGSNNPKRSKAGAATVIGASMAAYGLDKSIEEDARDDNEIAKEDQMMVLTRKMIEIRSMLQQVGQSSSLKLPSIVVIGSQSSGKSSVLEAIVGHEFLPKGSNMVTRRPIELTLVNTPGSKEEFGEFPDLGLRHITDFTSIQRTLTELNFAVSEADCVSDDPIHLTVYSPNVPDLSLIDLPGFIQVNSQNQPPELKQKISELCDKYIQPPNLILAISAADVDLANSAALRASKRVDPRGERTIGVITKMDLVHPSTGAAILKDKQYPLRLGYVGVISKATQSPGLFQMGSTNPLSAIAKHESSFFSSHPVEFGPEAGVNVGTTTLRKRLMQVLEQTMSSSLQTTSDAIKQELEEAAYTFKVQYNDRPLSAESYLAESLDAFKHSFKQFADNFGRSEMRELLRRELDQQVLNLLAARYWNKPITDLAEAQPEPDSILDLPKTDPSSLYWHRQLDASVSALTKLGVGRLATTVVASSLQSHVDKLLSSSNFATHPFAKKAILEAASTILNERFYGTSDQVENCIKPYKFEIEIDEREWTQGRQHVGTVLQKELQDCEAALDTLRSAIGGRRKLNEVMGFVYKARKGDVVIDGDGRSGAGGFSAALLCKGRFVVLASIPCSLQLIEKPGREAVFLRDRAEIIRMRLMAIRSKQCASVNNKYYCPEVFLDAVASKLASTAVLFLNVELLSEFYYNFPRELDLRLGRHLSPDEVEKFAKEDNKIRRHLELIHRKELLELVLQKIENLRQLESREREWTAHRRRHGQ